MAVATVASTKDGKDQKPLPGPNSDFYTITDALSVEERTLVKQEVGSRRLSALRLRVRRLGRDNPKIGERVRKIGEQLGPQFLRRQVAWTNFVFYHLLGFTITPI
jgi:hypothetical protein